MIPAHYDHCYGCGPEHPSGLRLVGVAGDGVSVHARMTVTQAHQGAPGLAHGGLVATAFDEALGFLMWLLFTPSVTGGMDVSFRRPVPVGTDLHVRTRCLGVEGRKIWTAGEATLGEDGPVAAVGRALFIEVSAEHFTRHGSTEPGALSQLVRRYNP